MSLLVRFLNLGSDDVIILETADLSFNTELSSTADPKRALLSNVGRAIVKKLAVKIKGNEILGVDYFDVFACYRDLWKTETKRWNAVRQGIIHSSGCTENCMKLQINALDKNTLTKRDTAIANSYEDKFIIHLDFEIPDSAISCYQSGLKNRICYEIMFNNYNQVIVSPRSPAKPEAKYKIADLTS